MNANMNHRIATPLPRVWWCTAAGASMLSAAIGLWWWIGGLVSASAASDGAGASGEVLEQARGRLSAGGFPQARELYRRALRPDRGPRLFLRSLSSTKKHPDVRGTPGVVVLHLC